jgi:hypothetical protein
LAFHKKKLAELPFKKLTKIAARKELLLNLLDCDSACDTDGSAPQTGSLERIWIFESEWQFFGGPGCSAN